MELIETLDNAVNYQKEQIGNTKYAAQFSLKPDIDIEITVELFHGEGILVVDFYSSGEDVYQVEKGSSTYVIFATIAKIVSDHIDEFNLKYMDLKGTNEKRADIFEKMVRRFGSDWQVYRTSKRKVGAIKRQ